MPVNMLPGGMDMSMLANSLAGGLYNQVGRFLDPSQAEYNSWLLNPGNWIDQADPNNMIAGTPWQTQFLSWLRRNLGGYGRYYEPTSTGPKFMESQAQPGGDWSRVTPGMSGVPLFTTQAQAPQGADSADLRALIPALIMQMSRMQPRGGPAQAYHSGGLPGQPSDPLMQLRMLLQLDRNEVPAVLEKGEVVINKNAAKAVGPGNLNALNQAIPRYHPGDVVVDPLTGQPLTLPGTPLAVRPEEPMSEANRRAFQAAQQARTSTPPQAPQDTGRPSGAFIEPMISAGATAAATARPYDDPELQVFQQVQHPLSKTTERMPINRPNVGTGWQWVPQNLVKPTDTLYWRPGSGAIGGSITAQDKQGNVYVLVRGSTQSAKPLAQTPPALDKGVPQGSSGQGAKTSQEQAASQPGARVDIPGIMDTGTMPPLGGQLGGTIPGTSFTPVGSAPNIDWQAAGKLNPAQLQQYLYNIAASSQSLPQFGKTRAEQVANMYGTLLDQATGANLRSAQTADAEASARQRTVEANWNQMTGDVRAKAIAIEANNTQLDNTLKRMIMSDPILLDAQLQKPLWDMLVSKYHAEYYQQYALWEARRSPGPGSASGNTNLERAVTGMLSAKQKEMAMWENLVKSGKLGRTSNQRLLQVSLEYALMLNPAMLASNPEDLRKQFGGKLSIAEVQTAMANVKGNTPYISAYNSLGYIPNPSQSPTASGMTSDDLMQAFSDAAAGMMSGGTQ